jgi:DNA-binding beta-propeller fold protein YncE
MEVATLVKNAQFTILEELLLRLTKMITNLNDNTVNVISSSGKFLGTYSKEISGPWGIAVDSQNNMWVANQLSNTVIKMNNTGSILKQLLLVCTQVILPLIRMIRFGL